MLAAIIRWSSRNVLLILMATIFVVAAGIYAVSQTPLDAIPDLSDPQVIVYTEYPGQAPQVVEDQVTYPLTTALLAVPRSKVVRGFSFFGVSFVYVVFEDGTDIYWARSRVLEYLNFAQKRLPAGVTPSLGPDATGVGWVFEYAVIGAQADAGRAAGDPGLVHPLSADQGRGRGRGRQRRRLRQAISGGGRSDQAARLRHPARQGHRGHSRQQHGCRRPRHRDERARVHGARPRVYPRCSAISKQIVLKSRAGHAGAPARRGAGRARARTSAAA